ncbi:MAG TPA: gluconate 2-dehydrogenase subunit 3 family protein [Acidimicrobiales bacterium]|nr:gluconate 2-dehydrogenase subunit 3 family protein [Acidimicrobiales bacterium]
MTVPGAGEAHFPGYDVLDQADKWDAVTAGVVLSRLAPPPPIRFFTVEEEPTARALVDRLLAQDHDPRVPALEMIDQRLLDGEGDGYRYDNMPEDREAWRRSVAGVDHDARRDHGRPFWDLSRDEQIDWIERFQQLDGEWHGLPAGRVFSLWTRYACDAFYSHPWAWNEIGFGGPAYPRGYKNLGVGKREPWEVAERDAMDPIPWAERVESARKRHAGGAA